LESIFEKFYRLDTARSSSTGGAGLGLAIAKEIVLAHGGKIYAESDGKSTVFTVELPIK
jgi:two-component system sensor histidine kinase VanS